MIAAGNGPLIRCKTAEFGLGDSTTPKLGFLKLPVSNCSGKGFGIHSDEGRSSFSVKAGEGSKMSYVNGKADLVRESHDLINDSDSILIVTSF